MGFGVRMVLDSIAPNGVRLATIEATFPRFILAELRTHRLVLQDDEVEMVFRGIDEEGRGFSMNSASSRAIPIEKMIQRVEEDPFIPERFPKNGKGMANTEWLEGKEAEEARYGWMHACKEAVGHARSLNHLGVHKQIVNRLLEPFMWHTVILSATNWSNFFAQRTEINPDTGEPYAQPEMYKIACMMKVLLELSAPTPVEAGFFRLPFIKDEERELWSGDDLCRISVARCARISYLQHDGTHDPQKDLALFNKLTTGYHWSPLEHVAYALSSDCADVSCGNFKGWMQYRKMFDGECR